MKTAFIGSALACVLATPALAGITCNLTDTRGNVLQYSFSRGWEGGTNELRVLRNNIALSNGGPAWSRFYDRGRNKLVLQQGNYSLAYDVRSDGLSPAGLFLGNNPIAMGTCGPDYSLDGPQPPQPVEVPAPPVINAPVVVQAPPAPAPDNSRLDDIERKLNDLASRPAPAPAPSQPIIVAPAAPAAAPVIINNSPAAAPAAPAPTIIYASPPAAPAPAAPTPVAAPPVYADPCQDPHYATSARCAPAPAPAAQAAPAPVASPPAKPAAPARDAVQLIPLNNALYLHVSIDGHDELMQLDTGANISTIKESLADSLVAAGEAKDMGTGEYVMANGVKSTHRTVVVQSLQLGSHRRGEVPMAVVSNDGMQLLGLSVLNSIGTFTVDSASNQLVFTTTETAALKADPTQDGSY
jgi:gag-polyprotein putative aspartyl protease